MRFADIRMCFVARYGGDPTKGDKLPPSHERSLKRALKGLRDRGEVLRIGGSGGPGDPYHYTTLECFAAIVAGKKPRDETHAKQIMVKFVAEMEALMRSDKAPKGLAKR